MASPYQAPSSSGVFRSRTTSEGMPLYPDAAADGEGQYSSLIASASSVAGPSSSSSLAPAGSSMIRSTSGAPFTFAPGVEEGSSTTSHASSSRLTTNTTIPASTSRQLYQPLSLADVLARSNDDATRALDEVLAERNKLCLEANKLGTENVRIWSLVRRIKRENEDLRAASRAALHTGNSLNVSSSAMSPSLSATSHDLHQSASTQSNLAAHHALPQSTSSRGSPLASSTTAPGMAPVQDGNGSHSRPPKSSSESNSSSGYYNVSVSSPIPYSTTNNNFPLSATSYVEGGPVGAVHEPPPLSSAAPPAAYSTPLLSQTPSSSSAAAFPAREAVQSPQQTSIMRQRAAAQAQRLAAFHNARPDGQSSSRASMESQDFEAIEGSSAANSDDERLTSDVGSNEPRRSDTQAMSRPAAGKTIAALGQGQDRSAMPPSTSTPEKRGNASSNGVGQGSAFIPRLDANMLPYVTVSVVGTNFRSSERAKEDIAFYINVELRGVRVNIPSWRIEKLFSAVTALDARLKQKNSKSKSAMKRLASATLPDRALFKDHAPSKVDQRKALLEAYLQDLVTSSLPDKDDLCTFFCTDASPIKAKDPEATSKEGYLTKKGANLGRWVTRLYVLSGPMLEYYETRGGPQLGTININGAQIGRQQRSVTADMDENSYRHAFLVLESKSSVAGEDSKQMIRHVLCAESDEERDEWVDVLVRCISSLSGPTTIGGAQNDTTHGSQRIPSATSASTFTSPSTPTFKRSGLPEAMRGSGASGDMRQSPRHVSNAARQMDAAYMSSVPNETTSSAMPTSSVAFESRASAENRQKSFDEPHRVGTKNTARTHPSAMGSVSQQPHTPAMPPPARPKANTLDQGISSSGSGMLQKSANGSGVGPLQLPESSSMPSALGAKEGSLSSVNRPAISGPMNGTPIPSGYKFGGKDEPSSNSSTDTKKRFWHRFGGAGSDKAQQSKQVFGVTLAESIAVSNVTEGLELPSVVYRCIEYLEKRKASSEEGIYRLSGSSAVIKSLRERFNAQGDVDLLASSEPFYDPHAIAGLLKQYLRELKDSVLTRELHLDFLRVNEIAERKDRVNELGHLVSLLPLANYSLLRTLCNHLIKVIEMCDVNKMTMRNVGIVFSPTLGIPGGVFALLLTEFDWVFFTDAKGEPAPRQMEEDIIAPTNAELGVLSNSPLRVGEQQQQQQQQQQPQQQQQQWGSESAAEPQAPAYTSRRGNRDSFISGDALRSGDGRVMTNLATKRDNRNSLCYNEAEAERLLGGPQSRYRLSAQREEMEAAMAKAPIEVDASEHHYMDADSDGTMLYSPSLPSLHMSQQGHNSPRGAQRQLQPPSASSHPNEVEPLQFKYATSGDATLRNTRSHSHNPRTGPAMPSNLSTSNYNASSNSDGHS